MAYLLILGTGDRCALNESQIGIGRAPDNEVAVPDEAVSIYHAMITVKPSAEDSNSEECILEDLESTNKTFVNNKEVTRYVLKNGDIIRVGNTRIKFSEGKYEPPPPDLKQTTKLKKVKTSDYLYTRKS